MGSKTRRYRKVERATARGSVSQEEAQRIMVSAAGAIASGEATIPIDAKVALMICMEMMHARGAGMRAISFQGLDINEDDLS